MREGERAKLHVPAWLGYDQKEQGTKGGAWYIPAESDLLFDIEVLRKKGAGGPAAAARTTTTTPAPTTTTTTTTTTMPSQVAEEAEEL